MSGISFDEWGGVDQHEARRMARDPEVKPLYMRVMFAAVGWSNLIGHAEFAVGGLAMILQSANPRTGEISIPDRNQVNAAIKRSHEMGLIADGSTFRCLIAAHWWEKAGGHGGKSCDHHGIAAGRKRHKRSVTATDKRHKRSVTATQEKCHGEPLTSNDAEPLYDSVLRSAQPPTNRQSA